MRADEANLKVAAGAVMPAPAASGDNHEGAVRVDSVCAVIERIRGMCD